MKFIRRIKNKIIPVVRPSLIYDDALSAAYQTAPIAWEYTNGLKLLLVHDGGSLSKTLIERFSLDNIEVTEINVLDETTEIPINADALLIAFEWTPEPEMLRLKSISNETYNAFLAKYTEAPLQIVRKVLDANNNIKILTLLPSFAFTEKYGFTVYGIAANHLVAMLEQQCGYLVRMQYVNIQYAKTLKAQTDAKANIISKDGSLGHILLREQVAAVVTMLLGEQGGAIKSNIIKIGVVDSTNMEYPIVNRRIDGIKRGSVCAGALADKNIMMLYNDEKAFLSIKDRLEYESSFIGGRFIEDDINEQQLLQLKREYVGNIDIVVNVIKPASNGTPITQLYRWLQRESPFLTQQNWQAVICNILLMKRESITVYEAEIKSFTSSLARLLGNHGFVVNSVVVDECIDKNNMPEVVAFLSSKYGEALTGETIIMK